MIGDEQHSPAGRQMLRPGHAHAVKNAPQSQRRQAHRALDDPIREALAGVPCRVHGGMMSDDIEFPKSNDFW